MTELPIIVGRSQVEPARPAKLSRVTVTQLMTPQDVNLAGNVFGGVILAAVDRIAYMSAARHAGRLCVTVSFDEVNFRSPILVGEVVTLRACVNTVGRTSVEVGVRVQAESVQGENRRHTNSSYVTMVAIDEEGRPVPVPRLEIRTQEEYRRYLEAEERRAARLALAQRQQARREAGRDPAG